MYKFIDIIKLICYNYFVSFYYKGLFVTGGYIMEITILETKSNNVEPPGQALFQL